MNKYQNIEGWKALDGKQFFATFPQNNTTKECAMERIKEHFNDNLEYAIVSMEKHADGNDHLHATFKTHNRYKASKNTCFNFIADKQGNYKSADNGAIQYTIKQGDYITYNIDVKKYLQEVKVKGPTKLSKGIFQQIVDDITITTTAEDIMLKYPAFYLQHSKRIKDYIIDFQKAHKPKKRDWEMNVSYLYGKTGTGKSREAYKDHTDETHYVLPRPQGGNMWFDGYNGQETIIIDDFSHADYSLTKLLNLLDRYAHNVPIKGGMIAMLAKNIIITSNYSPLDIYKGVDNPEHRNALYRRINTYKHFISLDNHVEYNNIEEIRNTQLQNIEDTNQEDIDDEEDIVIPMNTKVTKQIEPYRCHICEETFRTEQYLKLHNRKEHKETWMPNIKTDKDISKNKTNNKSPRLPASSAREK